MVSGRRQQVVVVAVVVAISVISVLSGARAQSTKGRQATQINRVAPAAPAPSPVTQLRQQQQQQQEYRPPAAPTKRRPQQQQQQQVIQQQQEQPSQQPLGANNYGGGESSAPVTEDPLADSEPALYGSVAGKPGVDFPAYTRIPKTSFTCEGKGFDFGFYADEEAQCQVYHVCWSGRRESFLCGVGTVFNQAILACDYWHSVDCSKSSQFYGVNSELGKAGAEPASGGQRQQQQPARAQTTPASTGSSFSGNSNGATYGEPVNQRRVPQAPVNQQPQQQTYGADDSNFDLPQQQPSGKTNTDKQQQFNVPQRNYDYQQQRVDTKSPPASQQPQRPPTPPTTLAPPVKRPSFNMDFNQKVNSLIESPVRAPLQPATKSAPRRNQSPAPQPTKQQPASFAQRARQSGGQNTNARKGYPTQTQAPAPVQQQQQQSYDVDSDDQQQQQQNFDDSPVQTSTSPYQAGQRTATSAPPASAAPTFTPQQQLVIRTGGSGDGSSAITTQYDTLNAPNNADQQQQYDSQADDSSSLNDDFRSAGAKAAASDNQNWYIMRAI